MAIEIGTVVWLKSGGPAMTIRYEKNNSYWVANWFDGNAVKEGDFYEYQLTEENPNNYTNNADDIDVKKI